MINPTAGHVLVRRDDEDAVTAGGLIIPEVARERPIRGTVIAVGDAVRPQMGETELRREHQRLVTVGERRWAARTVEMTVRPGDVVLMAREAPVEVDRPRPHEAGRRWGFNPQRDEDKKFLDDGTGTLVIVNENNILGIEDANAPGGIRLLLDRVLCERDPEDIEDGLILIPEIARKTNQIARVVAVGPGRISKSGARLPCDVKAGDSILIHRHAPDIEIGDRVLTIVGEEEILGAVEDERKAA